MPLIIHFIFIGEGTSDAKLVVPLRELCLRHGADDAHELPLDWHQIGTDVGHSVLEKVQAALSEAPEANLLFIHRDADGLDPTPRYKEIEQAINALSVSIPYVAVVPIQETEAWLLVDEEAILDLVRNPRRRVRLNLPSPKQVERIANPKERLKEILAKASGLKGRRLRSFNKKFPEHRRQLLEELDCEGPVSKVPAFKRLVEDISRAIDILKATHHI